MRIVNLTQRFHDSYCRHWNFPCNLNLGAKQGIYMITGFLPIKQHCRFWNFGPQNSMNNT